MVGQQQMTVQAALGQALQLLQSGQSDASARLLDRILSVHPEEPNALQLLGMIARLRKEHDRAIDLFRRSLKSNSSQPNVLNNLGNALRDLGRTGEAIDAYKAALRLQPSYADALTNLGIAHLELDEPGAAQDVLERATRAAPASAKAWSSLGRALRALGDMRAAIEAFQTSLRLRPNHVPTLHNFAVVLRVSGQADEAARILEHCAAADTDSAEIRYNLGHCYYDLGRLDEAAASYRAAIALKPTDRDAHDSLNRLYWQQGNIHDYLSSYATALRVHPNDAGLLGDFAYRLNLGGHTQETIRILEEALGRGMDGPAIRHRLGEACWALGRRDAALAHLRAGIAADPAATDCRLELARSLIIDERYADALETLGPVVERNPFDQQAIAYQALAWRFLGDPKAERLNDYDRFVRESILEPPEGWGGVDAFNHRLERVLAELHNTQQHPLEQTLRGGTQTMGELFDKNLPEIAAVRDMINRAVADYIAALPEDPDHVFLRRKSGAFRFSGSWSVRLRSQGFHLNHVHSDGWISSCYYVGLPQAVDRETERQGWIKFGETGLALGDRERVAKAMRPEVGKLVLFPSYMYHGTIPFEDETCRTTIAFDVVPA